MRASKPQAIPAVDLFAGPGGLGEGFAAVGRADGHPRFHIALSVENDPAAHQTLELRSFFRQFRFPDVPEGYYELLRGQISRADLFSRYPKEAGHAKSEALLATLGGSDADLIHRRVAEVSDHTPCWVLLGGPPCQAYSVVGRARNRGNEHYRAEDDPRLSLYEAYLHVIAAHWPPVFVMENVKGLLSAQVDQELILGRILRQLSAPGAATGQPDRYKYRILSLGGKSQFGDLDFVVSDLVVRAEDYGVPQARHRVILLGVREDLPTDAPTPLVRQAGVSVGQVLSDLPKVRSGLSRGEDSRSAWLEALQSARDADWTSPGGGPVASTLSERIQHVLDRIRPPRHGRGKEFVPQQGSGPDSLLIDWFMDRRLGGVCNHSTRAHIVEDLHRYLYAACYGEVMSGSPSLQDFPVALLPAHRSVARGHFKDRFRVQVRNTPATTVTSHIAKDGHYYIHFDPYQCRSLTVREAARLQTFPDNYLFCGPRTAQYTQIGNAVPPYLAMQIGETVLSVLREAGLAE